MRHSLAISVLAALLAARAAYGMSAAPPSSPPMAPSDAAPAPSRPSSTSKAPPADTPAPPVLSGTPSSREGRLNELVTKIEEAARASQWEAAEALVRQMASIDPDHPKVYLRAVLLQKDRRQIDQAAALMDTLGPKSGPGRVYGDAVLSFLGAHTKEAAKGFTDALATYETRGHAAGQAACHTMLGNIEKGTLKPDFNAVAKHFDEASRQLEALGDQTGLADILQARTEALLLAKRPGDAAAAAQQAVEVRRVIGGPKDLAKALYLLGRCHRATKKPKEALDDYALSLEQWRKANDQLGEAAVETEIALVHQDAGDFEAALLHERRALAVAEGVGDKREIARQHRVLADILIAAKRPREAVPSLEKAVAIYHEMKAPALEARALGALGNVWSDLGEIKRARQAFEPGLETARTSQDQRAEANALNGLGNLALATGDLARACLFHEEALRLYKKVEDADGELSSLSNLGAAYLRLGDWTQARSHIEEALTAAVKAQNRTIEAQSRNNLGVLLSAKDAYAEALDQARQSEALWKEVGNTRMSAITRANVAEALLRLGRIAEVRGLLDSALADLRKSGDLDGQAYCENLLGELRLAQGSRVDALSAHRRALGLAQEADSPVERWRARAGIAAALEAGGARQEARVSMLSALDEVERARTRLLTGELKARFFAELIDLYERALVLTLPPAKGAKGSRTPTPQEVASAFSIVERSRARSLLDALALPGVTSGKPDPEGLDRQVVEARDALGEALARLARSGRGAQRLAARRDVEKTRSALERAELRVRARWESEHPGSLPEAQPVPLAKLQQSVLRDDEGMLEYFVGRSGAWVFSITKRRASVQALASPREIAAKADALLRSTGGSAASPSAPDDERTAAEALSAVLLPASLPAGARLLVAPDGPLHHIPFEMLRTEGRFLVEARQVAVLPSASTLALLRDARVRTRRTAGKAPSGFLGVADPATVSTSGAALPALPFARLEVERIAGLLPESQRTILVGNDATRAKVLETGLGRFRFVHFATHAWLDAENPRNTGLRLGADEPNGGDTLLGVDDIRSLSMMSDLVVLSACSSAEGEAMSGEGLTGLTRAFLNAGARAVVVSLWDVSDRSTSDFMLDFYGRLVGGQDAAAALSATKRHFLTKDAAAQRRIDRWAPFILVGDPAKSNPGSNDVARKTTN